MRHNPVSILGIGYTGMVQLACFAKAGIRVVARDANVLKNDLLRRRETTVVEPKVQEWFEAGFENIKVVDDIQSAIQESNITFICVGTPSNEDGGVNLDAVFEVARETAPVLKKKNSYHIFVIRSTVPPGTSRRFIDILQEQSGKRYGKHFGVAMQPEFLREGTGIDDFMSPPFTILGTDKKEDMRALEKIYRKLGIAENIFTVSFEEAEIFKYLNNAFHGILLSFRNETVRLVKTFKGDPLKLMNIFVLDKKLNVSPYYLIGGLPFGGSCLPKDIRAVERMLKDRGMDAPTMQSALVSNERHYAFVFDELLNQLAPTSAKKRPSVGLVGVSFKKGVDDLRESTYVRVLQFLLQQKFEASFYDPLVDEHLILGANLRYAEGAVRNFFSYQILDVEKFIEKTDVVVVCGGNGIEEVMKNKHLLRNKKIICLNPFFYRLLEQEGIRFEKVI